jgi:hypothetical protein
MQTHISSQARWIRLAVTALTLSAFLPSMAQAAVYTFVSGEVRISATLADGLNTDVLQPGTSPVTIPLGGSLVELDPGIGANGAIVGLELIPQSDFDLDLDETVVGYDIITVSSAQLVEALGAQGLLDGSGDFFLDTEMSAIVTGVGGGPPPPTPIVSLTSGASGSAVVVGGNLYLGLVGINLATFPSLTQGVPDINVKADFVFVGIVPEPGTALLLGLGLAGLSTIRRREA